MLIGRLLRVRAGYQFAQSKKSRVNQMSYLEKLRIIEEMDRQTNIDVLKRELFNDTFQLPIKWLAFYSAHSSNQATFWAELIRSCIDASNHIILFGTNYINFGNVIIDVYDNIYKGPRIKFPYGIEKVKNVVVLVPAILFFYFGGQICYEALQSAYLQTGITSEAHGSPMAMALYVVSIAIEVSIIAKNIRDAQKVDSYHDEQHLNQPTFFSKVRSLFSKKDPLLQAILYENAITLSSTLVPIMSSLLTILHPTAWFEIVGSLFIGAIQLKLGSHLLRKNLTKLIGEEALDKTSMLKIMEIIGRNEFVYRVHNQKAVMLGSRNFRFAAEITFNTDRINDEIKEEFQEQMERIIYIESYQDREEYLQELLKDVPQKVLAKLHHEIQQIEEAIRNEFPNCTHLDLEINHKQQADSYEMEDENNLYFINQEDTLIPFEKWMLEEADRVIQYFYNAKQAEYPQFYQTAIDISSSVEYSKWEEGIEYDEDVICLEDYRFEELMNELNQKTQQL